MKSIAFILISIIISTLFSPFILSYTNEALDDQIDFLPYSIGDQQSNQFSGFLNLNDDNDKYIHYMYFESENNPDEDPIVFWYDFIHIDYYIIISDKIMMMTIALILIMLISVCISSYVYLKDEWWSRLLWIAWYDH